MKKRVFIITLAFAVVFTFVFATSKLLSANADINGIPEIEVDSDDYPLYMNEVPDGISDSSYIYGYLTKYESLKNSNAEDAQDQYEEAHEPYQLELVDDAATKIKLRNAMAAYGLNPDENRCFAMKATLFKYDENEGDYFVNRESTIKLLTPLSDNMYQTDEEEMEDYVDTKALMIVTLTSAGTLKDITSSCKLVYADDILSAQMTITSESVYGFILKNVPPDPDDEDDLPPAATSTPTPTPTPVPTKAPVDPSQNTNPTSTPTPTPMQGGNSSSNGNGGNGGNGGKTNSGLDSNPKTGDAHKSVLLLLGAGICVVVLVGVTKKLKKI